jgi:N-methylhydantoinase A
LHAADVAKSLGLSRVIVPNAPGILCADGLIESDLQENFVATCRAQLGDDLSGVETALAGLDAQADAWIATEADGIGIAHKIASVDMRYVGQNYELPVVIGNSRDAPILPGDDALIEGFFDAHLRSYGYVDRTAPVEVMNVRLKAVAPLGQIAAQPVNPDGPAAPEFTQDVWFTSEAAVPTPVYRRGTLPIGTTLTGPAIITQFDATTVIPPNATVAVDDALNMILELQDV